MAEWDFDDSGIRALRQYARAVGVALSLGGDCWCVEEEPRGGIYLPLDGRVAAFPEHDVALLWDEKAGWSASLETTGGADVVLERFTGPAKASPADVAAWAADLLRTEAVDDLTRVA